MNCIEAEELITAMVDSELSDLERNATESHIKNCLRCQYVYKAKQELKRQVRLTGSRITAPANLKEKILSDRRLFPEMAESPRRWGGYFRPARVVFRPAFALAFLMLLVLPTFYLMWPTAQPVSLASLETHEQILAGVIPFISSETQEEIKERLYRSVEKSFAPMGYDLSLVGLKAVGGLVQEVASQRILVTVYEGRSPSLSCFTYLDTYGAVPPNAHLFFDPEKKMSFYTFSNGRTNGVMQRVAGRVCILVSKMPMEELLALARSLAQPS